MKNAWEGDLGSPKTAAGKRNTRHSLLTCDATGVFARRCAPAIGTSNPAASSKGSSSAYRQSSFPASA
jgi:hypothetical protein